MKRDVLGGILNAGSAQLFVNGALAEFNRPQVVILNRLDRVNPVEAGQKRQQDNNPKVLLAFMGDLNSINDSQADRIPHRAVFGRICGRYEELILHVNKVL